MTAEIPALIPASRLGNGHWISRRRRAGLLDAPTVQKAGVNYYSRAQVDEMHRRYAKGMDIWMQVNHGRGRPRLDEIGKLAGGEK
jgi:hypothetical protein